MARCSMRESGIWSDSFYPAWIFSRVRSLAGVSARLGAGRARRMRATICQPVHDHAVFASFARRLEIPPWPGGEATSETLPAMRLVLRAARLSGVGLRQPGRRAAGQRAAAQPRRAVMRRCRRLDRPPILSYDGYALYNWKRFDADGPIALGNIDTLQNFVHLYDEHWFILVHVEIEAIAAEILAAIDAGGRAHWPGATRQRSNRGPVADRRAPSGGRSACCGGFPRRWTRPCTTRPSGRTSASSKTWSTRESTHARSISAARRGPRAASCRRWWPS